MGSKNIWINFKSHLFFYLQKVTKTEPMLMVVGGYNATVNKGYSELGFLDDVELISTTSSSNKCSKYVSNVGRGNKVDLREVFKRRYARYPQIKVFTMSSAKRHYTVGFCLLNRQF